MSRIGKKPIILPEKVEVSITKGTLTVKGPKGELTMDFDPAYVTFSQKDDQIIVDRKDDTKVSRSRHGLYRSLANNLVKGVTDGFSKTLEIKGVGYRGAIQGDILELNLGFSHPVKYKIPQGITVKFQEKSQNIFTVSGINKQLVGQVSSEIRSFRKPEPYKGKGIRYIDEQVARKAGKAVAK